MKTKPNIGDRVFKPQYHKEKPRYGTVREHHPLDVNYVYVVFDDLVSEKLLIDFRFLGRLVKKPNKDKQRIAELEAENKLLNDILNALNNEAEKRDLFGVRGGAMRTIEFIVKEHAEMKKSLSGETYWVGHSIPVQVGLMTTSFRYEDQLQGHSTWPYHTKVLVLETKAAGEV